ncbi:hypothetical protein BDV23DRAFT_177503 [Aspergillus alliaceus]|uniref:Nucleotide-diphospho-sugar transferase n=1 Tax=Petromyces alliaceus TaxID=209559 RepID=A0A5N7CQY2_PETAA|nr:hypothetical protein BDV23DRAFT_177503 [Aspergillus alliaceus]
MPVSLGWRPLSQSGKILVVLAGISMIITLGTLRERIPSISKPIVSHHDTATSSPSPTPPSPATTEPPAAKPKPKYAFATIITGEGDVESDVKDAYFTATRLLTYQLLYGPQTKSRAGNIPFLVLVTKDVPQEQRDRLVKDGATVIPAESLARERNTKRSRLWTPIPSFSNLWTTFFTDNTTALQQSIPPREGLGNSVDNDFPLPEAYLLSGIHDRWVEQALPPVPENDFYAADNYINAGFFVLSPSETLFNYYVHLLDTADRFDATYPEQNLLNCAHRVDGRIP